MAFRRLGVAFVLGELAHHDRPDRRGVRVGRRRHRLAASPALRPGRAARAGTRPRRPATVAADAPRARAASCARAPRAPVVVPVARCVAVIRVQAEHRGRGEFGRRAAAARAVEHGLAEGEDLGMGAPHRPSVGERREHGEDDLGRGRDAIARRSTSTRLSCSRSSSRNTSIWPGPRTSSRARSAKRTAHASIAASGVGLVAGLGELELAELAHRLEHPVPRRGRAGRDRDGEQRLGDEPVEEPQGVGRTA